MKTSSLWILAPAAVVFGVWELVASLDGLSFFIGRPTRIAMRLLTEVSSGGLLLDLAVTGWQATLGLLIGGGLGALFGIALGMNATLRRVAAPYVDALGVIPPIAFGPIAVLTLGTGFEMKAGFAALSAALVMLGYAFVGVAAIDVKLLEFARSTPHRRRRMWSLVVLPASLGWIVGGARAALGAALIGAFVGELVSASEGLGFRIQRSLGLVDIDGVWVAIIGFAALGLVATGLLQLISEAVTRRVRHRVAR